MQQYHGYFTCSACGIAVRYEEDLEVEGQYNLVDRNGDVHDHVETTQLKLDLV